jgi:hypothetical protein
MAIGFTNQADFEDLNYFLSESNYRNIVMESTGSTAVVNEISGTLEIDFSQYQISVICAATSSDVELIPTASDPYSLDLTQLQADWSASRGK